MKALFQMSVTKKMGVPSPFSCQSRDMILSWEEQVTYLSHSPYPHLHVTDALVEVRVAETLGFPSPQFSVLGRGSALGAIGQEFCSSDFCSAWLLLGLFHA